MKEIFRGDIIKEERPKTEVSMKYTPTNQVHNLSRNVTIEREGWGYKDLIPLDLIDEEVLREFEENHRQYKGMVKEILEYYDKATNNDFILYIEALRVLEVLEVTSGKDNFVFKIPRDKIKYVPSPESITRARRSLNERGIGLPTNKSVFIRRMKRQKAIKKYFKEEK